MSDEERATQVGELILQYDSTLTQLAHLKCKAKGIADNLKPIAMLLAGDAEGEVTKKGLRVTHNKYGGKTYSYPPMEDLLELLTEIEGAKKTLRELKSRIDSLRLGVRVLPPETGSSDS